MDYSSQPYTTPDLVVSTVEEQQQEHFPEISGQQQWPNYVSEPQDQTWLTDMRWVPSSVAEVSTLSQNQSRDNSSLQQWTSPAPQNLITSEEPPSRSASIYSDRSNDGRATSMTRQRSNSGGKKSCHICKKDFKDLTAHLETHNAIRQHRCTVPSCTWSGKGHARKHDTERHIRTHWKGGATCSATDCGKWFQTCVLFRAHLVKEHGAETRGGNDNKKADSDSSPSSPGSDSAESSPVSIGDGSRPNGITTYREKKGKNGEVTIEVRLNKPMDVIICPCCHTTQATEQALHHHVNDCVLDKVGRTDPTELINMKNLQEIPSPEQGQALPVSRRPSVEPTSRSSSSGVRKSRVAKQKKPTDPKAWGKPQTHKKRVQGVYNGQIRIANDDMFMSNAHQVMVSYTHSLTGETEQISDLDINSMKRLKAFEDAATSEITEEASNIIHTGFYTEHPSFDASDMFEHFGSLHDWSPQSLFGNPSQALLLPADSEFSPMNFDITQHNTPLSAYSS